MAITASEARKDLFPLIEQANNDGTAVEITSKRGSAVLMSREDCGSVFSTIVGGLAVGVVANSVLIPLLTGLLLVSARKVWGHR